MLNIDKDYNVIMSNALARLENSPVSGVSKGAVAKLLLAIFNEEFAKSQDSGVDGFYDILKREIVQAVLSKAVGGNLDAIGNMMDCVRNTLESDENYRWRISQQLKNLATANEVAVKLACLSVAGVDDVIMKPYTYGTGSGSIYVVTSTPSLLDSIVPLVQTAAAKAGAFGSRIEVFKPRLVEVIFRARVIFYKDTLTADQKLLRSAIKGTVESYINSLLPGAPLDVPWLKETIAKTSDRISETVIYELYIDGEPVLPVTQQCAWNERFVVSSEADAVVIS